MILSIAHCRLWLAVGVSPLSGLRQSLRIKTQGSSSWRKTMVYQKPPLDSSRAEEERSELHEFTSFPLLLLPTGMVSFLLRDFLHSVSYNCYMPRAQVSSFHSCFRHRTLKRSRDVTFVSSRPSGHKGLPW